MWHFWGTEKELKGALKVLAIHQDTGEKKEVLDRPEAALSPNNGADHHIPSNMELPKPGLWRLDVFINEKLFGSIVVNVKKE